MPYRFLEGVTRADVCIEATGKDLTQLFQGAADGTNKAMVEPDSVKPAKTIEISVENDDPEKLLFDFIEEIVYIKDAKRMVFNKIEAEVEENKARARLTGDEVKPEEQELNQDVKAVTMHYFKLEQTEKGWRAQFVLDI